MTTPPYVTNPPVSTRTNGPGIASIIVGGIALLLSFIPFVNYATGFFAVAGLVLGIIGLVLRGRRKGTAIAGTIVSFVALATSIALAIAYTAAFAAAVKSTADEEKKRADTPITLVYEVTGTSKNVTIDYTSFTNDNEGSEQVSDAKLPFSKTLTVKQGGDFDFSSYSLTATNGLAKGTVSCTITLDGKVVSHHTSSGELASAVCSYSK